MPQIALDAELSLIPTHDFEVGGGNFDGAFGHIEPRYAERPAGGAGASQLGELWDLLIVDLNKLPQRHVGQRIQWQGSSDWKGLTIREIHDVGEDIGERRRGQRLSSIPQRTERSASPEVMPQWFTAPEHAAATNHGLLVLAQGVSKARLRSELAVVCRWRAQVVPTMGASRDGYGRVYQRPVSNSYSQL
jgi:hypothetical protein